MRDISWFTEELLASQEGFSKEVTDTLQETMHVNRACFANASCLLLYLNTNFLSQNAKKQQAMEE